MKIFIRFFFVLLFGLVFFTEQFSPAFAQTSPTNLSQYTHADVDSNVPQNIHSLTQIVTTEIIATLICQLSGIDITQKNHSCLGIDPNTHRFGYAPNSNGLIGIVFYGIENTYQVPVHAKDYIDYMANKAGFVDKTYAAQTGNGFNTLQPMVGLWATARNIVYLLFVVVFVLVGVAIMFRVQIDPRTVMTIENQLPKIVITLILVTFSFAIAGFMVDMMWVLTYFIINLIGSVDASIYPDSDLTKIATGHLFDVPLGFLNEVLAGPAQKILTGASTNNGHSGLFDLLGAADKTVQTVIQSLMTPNTIQNLGLEPPGSNPTSGTGTPGGCDIAGWIVGSIFPPAMVNCQFQQADQQLQGQLSQQLGSAIGWLIGYVLGDLAALILLIAVLIAMFRVWFMLLQALAYFIIDIILGPFIIIAGLIPGSQVGFGSWFQDVAANLLAFPFTVFMFLVARVILDSFVGNPGNAGSGMFIPPLIGNPNGDGNINPIGIFMVLAIIFITPEAHNLTKKALSAAGLGLGTAVAGGFAAGGQSAGRLTTGGIGAYIDLTQSRTEQLNAPRGWRSMLARLGGR